MRIGLDYRVALAHAPGVGRYVRELARALAALAGEGGAEPFTLALLDLGLEPRAMDEEALALRGRPLRRVRVPLPRSFALRAARRIGADRLLGVDVFHHARAPHLPVRRALQTAAVAELPAPGSTTERELAARLEPMHGVFVFSAHAERELARRFALDPARIARTSVGCEHWLRDLREPVGRADPPEVLVLGAIAQRRRPLAALRAFEALRAGGREARLVFVGRPGDAARELEAALARSPARASLEWVREPLERELPERVARAAALLHLSADEATPVTPLEAFALGTPVVASALPAFVEALGGAASLIEDEEAGADPTRLAALLDAAIASAADERAAADRRAIARPFTWRRAALDSLAAWRTLLALK